MGASSSVRMHNLGGRRDSRKDVNVLASQSGFRDVLGTDQIGTASMGAYLRKIGSLEREYGALKAVPTVLAGADGSGFHAAAASSNNGAAMVLNRRSMGNAAKHAKASASEAAAGFKMETDGRLTSQANYTVTHEYGHLLQGALYKKARDSGYTGSESQFRSKAKREIDKIATGKYGGSGRQMSRYGHTNSAEFFAEAFASANSGKPNAYGKAMSDWLKKNRL